MSYKPPRKKEIIGILLTLDKALNPTHYKYPDLEKDKADQMAADFEMLDDLELARQESDFIGSDEED